MSTATENTNEVKNEGQSYVNKFHRFQLKVGAFEITCMGVEALEQASKILRDRHTEDMGGRISDLANGLMQKIVPYMPPEQRTRGEAATVSSEAETDGNKGGGVAHISNLGATTRRSSSKAPNQANVSKQRGKQPPSFAAPGHIMLSPAFINGCNKFMACVSATSIIRLVDTLYLADDHSASRKELKKALGVKSETVVSGMFAQARNKCAKTAGIDPDGIIYKVTNKAKGQHEYALGSAFVEYLRRRKVKLNYDE